MVWEASSTVLTAWTYPNTEVLAEGTAILENDGRLTVPRQGFTRVVEKDLPTHAEVE
jgi:hypothetical protein